MKIIIMCALTVDGKIARGQKELVNWTSKEDKKIFARETKKAGVVILGRNTYETFGRPLKERLNVVLTANPKDYESQRGRLEFTSKKPRDLVRELSRRGFKKAFVIGGSQINSLFLKEKLVNEVWLTLAPKIFGQGISLANQNAGEHELKLVGFKKLPEGYLFLKYLLL